MKKLLIVLSCVLLAMVVLGSCDNPAGSGSSGSGEQKYIYETCQVTLAGYNEANTLASSSAGINAIYTALKYNLVPGAPQTYKTGLTAAQVKNELNNHTVSLSSTIINDFTTEMVKYQNYIIWFATTSSNYYYVYVNKQ